MADLGGDWLPHSTGGRWMGEGGSEGWREGGAEKGRGGKERGREGERGRAGERDNRRKERGREEGVRVRGKRKIEVS